MTTSKSNGNGTTVYKNGNGSSKGKGKALPAGKGQKHNVLGILEQVLDAVVTINSDKEIIFCNDTAVKIFGYEKEELLGQDIKMIVPIDPQDNQDGYVDANTTAGLDKMVGIGRDIEMVRKDGSGFWGNLSLSKVEFDGMIQYTAFIKDVTNQKERDAELKGQIEAINSTSASIEFNPDGTIVTANGLFLQTMGYDLNEIQGQHHQIFVDSGYAKSNEYKKFWADLKAGLPQTGEFKRYAKDGSQVWLLANYTPVRNQSGEVIKVIKLASNITGDKLQNADFQGQIAAISKAQAVIEFNLDGTIITANENFLQTVGYTLEEIEGQHHSIFVEDSYKNSGEYQAFWKKLNNGQFETGEIKRIGKNGKEIWLQASYNPIFDIDGVPIKVVKFAADVTEQKIQYADFRGQLEAVSKANAVIEFTLEGTIVAANDNFLSVVGYGLDEIRGKHHRIFCEEDYANGEEYRAFWEKLNRGEFSVGTYRRLGKGGKEVYIQATYNPILDLNGNPYKVIKYATDITEFTVALKAVSDFASELKEGNFDAQIDVKADGDVGKMIEDNLSLRDTLKEIINDVNNVVKSAGEEGNLNARLELQETKGAWKDLVDSMNQLLQSIADPVLEFNSIITEMAKGDLTKKFEMQAKGDIQNMADSLNTAVDNLNNLLSTIGENADVVAQASASMLEKSESMKNNTSEVASAIGQIAKGAQDQATKTDESSKLVEDVKNSAVEMESKSDVINNAAERGQKSCENGLKIIRNMVENMSGITESANLTSESINILTDRAVEIGRTLNVITDIAAQTNLLALNAAIEAARAGEAGRGFAVVAEEIRKLAEDSRKSAVDIEKIIADVQKDTQAAGKAIETMESSVTQGTEATTQAESIFQEIAKSSEETLNFSKEIKESTSVQKSSIESVAKNIEQIVVVAEETAAGTQQAAGSSQQMNAGMEEVAASSSQLSEIAAELQTGVNQFQLKK